MARPNRINAPGALYHLTTRGNLQADIFLGNVDREVFLEIVADTVERHEWICHSYCLMTNHYHLLVQTPEGNLSAGMQYLNGRYARAFNRHNGRSGHLFERRFRDRLIERQEHLLEVARYVVLNPVRAGLRQHPGDWPWSSYLATAGLAPCPKFLTTSWLLGNFHAQDDVEARTRFRSFVAAGSPATSLEGLLSFLDSR